MPVEPKIYLFTARPTVRVVEEKNTELLELAEAFSRFLSGVKLDLLKIKSENAVQEVDIKNSGLVPFFNLQVEKDNAVIEEIHIYAEYFSDELRFIISPVSVTNCYNFLEDNENAKDRTAALKQICDLLFSITKSDILVTTHSEDPGPQSSYQAYRQWLPDSTFSIISNRKISPDSQFIRNLKLLPVYEGLIGDKVELSVTDHPFSLVDFNSTETSEERLFTSSSFLRYRVTMNEFCVDNNDKKGLFFN